jgi:hypothetical protein
VSETPAVYDPQVGRGVPAEPQLDPPEAVDSSSPELSPCPFCGAAPKMCTHMDSPQVMCKCGCDGPCGASVADAADKWNRRFVPAAGMVSTIRWTRVEDGLPAYGQAVAVWIPAIAMVVRAYRVAMSDADWRVCGGDGPRILEGLVAAWTEIPNGVVPPPDGGAA